MRPLLVVLAGVSLSCATSLAVWAAVEFDERPYYEILEGGLLRTNAPEKYVNVAVDETLRTCRPDEGELEQRIERSCYQESADAWFTRPDVFGYAQERASRLVREQVDRFGHSMRVEVIQGPDMPTLIFLQHGNPEGAKRVAIQIAAQLSNMGIAPL